jgi:branched-subunit amino acid transport protein
LKSLLFVVILMALVTYIPRMIPLVFLTGKKLPPYAKRFFQFMPYATLGALIVPGVLSSTGRTLSAAFGAFISTVLAYLKLNVLFVVLGGIGGVVIFELLF